MVTPGEWAGEGWEEGLQVFLDTLLAAWSFHNKQTLFLLVCFIKWRFTHCILQPKLKPELALT